VSICAKAKAEGRQYTKRMLPDFLMPYARMRLDLVLEAAKKREEGMALEQCSRIMGCVDLDTVRRHLRRIEEAAAATALLLAERHAAAPHLSENNQELRPLPLLNRLKTLYRVEREMHLHAGTGHQKIPGLRYLLQAVLWQTYGKVSTSFPSRSPPYSCYTC
jgi:hypothetical protein